MMQSRRGRNKNLQNLTKSEVIEASLSLKFWLMPAEAGAHCFRIEAQSGREVRRICAGWRHICALIGLAFPSVTSIVRLSFPDVNQWLRWRGVWGCACHVTFIAVRLFAKRRQVHLWRSIGCGLRTVPLESLAVGGGGIGRFCEQIG